MGNEKGFTPDQLAEIEAGKKAGLKTEIYANPEYLAIQMRQIRLVLEQHLDAKPLCNPALDWFQMEEIRLGLESGVDVSRYASPDQPYARMRQMRRALESGVDISDFLSFSPDVIRQLRKARVDGFEMKSYAEQGYDAEQIKQIRYGLRGALPIKKYLNKDYRAPALEEIRIGLEKGLDVSIYAHPEYDWRQMREIRLGLEQQVDVSKYSDPLYTYRQMMEIRLGLVAGIDVESYRRMRYSATDMRNMRQALEQGFMSALSTATSVEDLTELMADEEEPYSIVISEDGMEAYLIIRDPSAVPAEDALLSEIWNAGIHKGMLRREIKKASEGQYGAETVLIACGQSPRAGKDGWYEFFFRTDVNRKPKILEDGSVDYRDVEWYDTVEAGTQVALYHSAEEGTDGYDVYGKTIPTVRGKELKVLNGSGFKLSEDRKSYIAKIDGMVSYVKERLEIVNVLELDDVTTATGDVVFDGNLHIRGNVGFGVLINAKGDLVVDGFVEGANIHATGEILLRKGMNGGGKGQIHCDKTVTAKFLESTEVHAGESIKVNYSVNSVLHAEEMVVFEQRNAMVMGGRCTGVKGVEAQNVGSRGGTPTLLIAGVSERLIRESNEVYGRLKSTTEELRMLVNARNEMYHKYPREVLAEQEVYRKVEDAIYTKETDQKELSARQEELRAQLLEISRAKVVVHGTVFTGAKIQIGKELWEAETDLLDVTLQKIRSGGKEEIVVRGNREENG
jgi:uncharacterized protein (DUF342 family)